MAVATQGVGMEELRAAIRTEFGDLFADLHRFVDCRIAELSAEVHGATQLMDYSEANITGQLGKVHDRSSACCGPAAATRNSGLELEAVVQATEQAANQIMEAAEAIGDWLASGDRDPASVQGGGADQQHLRGLHVPGPHRQRIRRAIEHLQKVETMLGGMIPEAPGRRPAPEPPVAPLHATTHSLEAVATPDLDQDEIDRLLNG